MKCFYHSSDLDGHCSGAIVRHAHPECEMFPINYGDPFPWEEVDKDELVIMVDFSLQPFTDMIRLMNHARLIWIDHHKSAIDEYIRSVSLSENKHLPTTVYGRRSVERAACELTWEFYFKDKPIPLAVILLGLYDSWRFHGHELEPMVLRFQTRMRMEDLNPNGNELPWLWKALFDADPTYPAQDIVHDLVKQGGLLLNFDDKQKAKYVAAYAFDVLMKSTPVPCDGQKQTIYSGIAVNLGLTNSRVFESVWDPDKYDLMITFVLRPDMHWNVSLYSDKDDVPCHEIARAWGGGGHPGASGFQCADIRLPFFPAQGCAE